MDLSKLVSFVEKKEQSFFKIALSNYIIYLVVFILGVFLVPNSILMALNENTSVIFNILASILLFGIFYMRITAKIFIALALLFLIVGLKIKDSRVNILSSLYFILFISQVILFKLFIVK